MPEAVRLLGVALTIGGGLWQLHFHRCTVLSLRSEAEDMYTVQAAIGPDATVLPLNYSGNWMHGNFANYLGTVGNTIVLDNFVARTAHAPIRWHQQMEPFTDVGNFDSSLLPCVDLVAWTDRTGHCIDHVLTLQMPEQPTDSCTLDTQRQLRELYSLAFTSPTGKVKLYTLLRKR